MRRPVAGEGSEQDQTTLAAVPFSSQAVVDELLCLRVVFHPQPQLWDACCQLTLDDLRKGVHIGRLQPLFLTESGEASLADPYVSRRAATLRWSNDWLMMDDAAGVSLGGDGLPSQSSVQWSASAVRRGFSLVLAERVVLWLQLAPALEATPGIPGLLGESPIMQSLRRQVSRMAAQAADVLLLGETGTGKERVAEALHELSPRRKGPLLRLNMAAVPETLAAAELFGVRRGAHSAASKDAAGYFQRAAGGTLFLDEIGATPASVQAQLLRALENRELQPVGGAPVAVDLRVISATDADLDRSLGFSAALRHRIGALEIKLPTLSERRADVGQLLRHFLRAAGVQIDEGVVSERAVSLWAMLYQRCLLADWPGNLRQLRNHATQIAALGIESVGLPPVAALTDAGQASASGPLTNSDAAILSMLEVCHYDVARASRALGLSRQALYRFIERSPVLRKVADIPREELVSCLSEACGDLPRMAQRCKVSVSALQRRLKAEGLTS